jgi:hypothetical protein
MNPFQKIHYWYRWLFQPHYLAGERAEQYFEQLARAKGYVLEKVTQDRKSFADWNNLSIKRGDYLVRNLQNLEIEVKCFSTRKFAGKDYYLIKYSHIKRHKEMANTTNTPVVFAIFTRNGRNAVENSLRMIPLNELTPPSRRNKAIIYDQRIKCLWIPTTMMYPNFSYFERYKTELDRFNSYRHRPLQQ